jgi:hypothetical protein
MLFDCIKITTHSGELNLLQTVRQTITRMPIGGVFTLDDLTWQLEHWFKQEIEQREAKPNESLAKELHRLVIAFSFQKTPGWYLCDEIGPDTYKRVETGEQFIVPYTIEEELAYLFGPEFSFPTAGKSLQTHESATGIIACIQKGQCKSPATGFSFVNRSTGQCSFYGLFGLMDENDAQFFSEAVSEHFHQSGPTAIEFLTEGIPAGYHTPEDSPLLQRLVEALTPYAQQEAQRQKEWKEKEKTLYAGSGQ